MIANYNDSRDGNVRFWYLGNTLIGLWFKKQMKIKLFVKPSERQRSVKALNDIFKRLGIEHRLVLMDKSKTVLFLGESQTHFRQGMVLRCPLKT